MELPEDVRSVLDHFLCAEFATVTKDGTAMAWPVVPLHLPEREVILVTTSIGYAVKAMNAARDARVSLLFSDGTGSGLQAPPTVLVQGLATVDEQVRTWGDDLAAHWRRVQSVQPSSRWPPKVPILRQAMDWYYMRLMVYITPMRVRWAWPHQQADSPQEWYSWTPER